MPTAYDVLNIEFNKCPADCRRCEEACAREKGENIIDLSRIKPVHAAGVNFHGALTCIQCGQPRCQQVCPAGAIEKSTDDGIVRIDESRCVGCGLCTLACPYGGIYYNSRTEKAFKCDQCDGNPQCIEACPYKVITHVQNSPVLGYLQSEDVVTSGTGACRGCPAELALRFTLRVFGKNTILFTAPGCVITFLLGFGTQAQINLAQYPCLMTNVAAIMTGVYRYYRSIGRDDINLVSFVGDGATVDIGLQPLSGAAERGERIIYICYDNEGYMNTGVQRSSSTPLGVRTTTTPAGKATHGKQQNQKYMPLIMLNHGISYVATATMAYPDDYALKLTKAKEVRNGMSYIHLFSPCPTGWGLDEDKGLDAARLAVETNHFPLWEAEDGKVRLTFEVAKPRPVQEYTSLLGKYSHLSEADLEIVQQSVNARYKMIETLASSL